MDEADMSQSRLEREDEIKHRYISAPRLEVPPTGYCLNCDEPLPPTARWCGPDCLHDWSKRRLAKNK